MPPKFGTSGLRGLVTELTSDLVGAHVRAFVRACPTGTGLFIGQDLRASSPDIAPMVASAAQSAGIDTTDCGPLPTPALALAAMEAGAAAVMITGSHIPDDRNGLKFYTPAGEITKDHETAILSALKVPDIDTTQGATQTAPDASALYLDRYLAAYGPTALTGLTIGNYTHSAVGRDLTRDILSALGATVIELGRAGHFVPVDTEAVAPETRAQLTAWATEHSLDAIVSTDGDGDRPLMSDATGTVIPGDILGQITCATLGVDTVVTPVSSNTGVEAGNAFASVIRTRIGSPYVIAGMESTSGRVAGYEANGGFLLGFAATAPAGPLPALMTRDSLLPIIAPLVAAQKQSLTLAKLVKTQPARFTAADRLQEVDTDAAQALIATLRSNAAGRDAFAATFDSTVASVDETDGLRMTLATGRIVHLRPSGNAPELRLYIEDASAQAARSALTTGLAELRRRLG